MQRNLNQDFQPLCLIKILFWHFSSEVILHIQDPNLSDSITIEAPYFLLSSRFFMFSAVYLFCTKLQNSILKKCNISYTDIIYKKYIIKESYKFYLLLLLRILYIPQSTFSVIQFPYIHPYAFSKMLECLACTLHRMNLTYIYSGAILNYLD